MSKSVRLSLLVAAGLSALAPVAAPAQDMMDQAMDTSMMSMGMYAGSIAIEDDAKRSFQGAVGGSRGGRGIGASAFGGGGIGRPGTARPVPLTYAATPALKKQVLDEFIARVRSKNAAHADAARAQFSKYDYGRVWQGITAPFGLRSNDAGDALTAYLVLGWMIVNGAGDPSAADVRGVRAQVGAALARDSRFTSPTGRAKLGEEFKILFVTLHSGWQSARREGALRQYGQGVAQMIRQQSGINLQALALNGGFEPRG